MSLESGETFPDLKYSSKNTFPRPIISTAAWDMFRYRQAKIINGLKK